MKRKTKPSLEELRKEIERLKVQKAKKLQIATSMTERNKLLKDINELNTIQRSSNTLRNFGKTLNREMKTTRKVLFAEISKASRNLDHNSPEFRNFDRTMISQPLLTLY